MLIFPKIINKLVKEIEKNINIVDDVIDSLKDIVNVIEDEIKNAISKLEDAVKIAIDEIMKIKNGFLKFVKGVGNIFVQLFEIILKISDTVSLKTKLLENTILSYLHK